MQAVLEGKNTLAVLPTGSGKSAIYQVAGIMRGGLTVVISPLISLQRDQLRSISGRSQGPHLIMAALLNSTQSIHERTQTLHYLSNGDLDFLLIGPEQLANEETASAIRAGARAVTLLCVDEAHLVSEWGHEFRPEYLRIVDALSAFDNPPLLAMTATASSPVQSDITRRLGMQNPFIVVGGFDRPNISFAMRLTEPASPEPQAVDDRCAEVLSAQEVPALVYALTRSRCEALASRLQKMGQRAAAYHGGMSSKCRAHVQDSFFAGNLDVVVATSAFGLGVDKPDIRTVVHAGVPASIDEYYQEVGRAGRDGQPAAAILVHDARTIRIPRSLAARSNLSETTVHCIVDAMENAGCPLALADLTHSSGVPSRVTERIVNELADMGIIQVRGTDQHRLIEPQRDRHKMGNLISLLLARDKRRQMILASRLVAARHFAETTQCRRAELLAYFGESYMAPCGNCDNDRKAKNVPIERPTAKASTRGTPVHHRLWGEGTLLSEDDHELLVYFNSVGYKHLISSALKTGILLRTHSRVVGAPADAPL